MWASPTRIRHRPGTLPLPSLALARLRRRPPHRRIPLRNPLSRRRSKLPLPLLRCILPTLHPSLSRWRGTTPSSATTACVGSAICHPSTKAISMPTSDPPYRPPSPSRSNTALTGSSCDTDGGDLPATARRIPERPPPDRLETLDYGPSNTTIAILCFLAVTAAIAIQFIL